MRDQGLCCFTGRPSDCITWVIPPLLSHAVTVRVFIAPRCAHVNCFQPPAFTLERCLSLDNVFTISSDLLEAYHDKRIAVDPQVQMSYT